jgi:RND family efflux transporter MFP subunit
MKRVIAVIGLGVAAGGLLACGGREHRETAAAPQPLAVTVAAVAAVDAREPLEAGGVVAARESAAVSSRIVAPVASVLVKAGDRVRAGQVLLTLDARDVVEHTRAARAGAVAAEQSLVRARTEQAAAEADHRLAAAWQKRIAALHERRSATDQERDEAEARLAAAAARLAGVRAVIAAADAGLASARAAADAAAATESFAALRAPFDGLVSERLTDPGNLAAPGVPLLTVESDGARQALVRVDEARAAYVRTGDRVSVDLAGLENTDDDAGTVEGVVAEVARAIGVDQHAFTVKIALPPAVTATPGGFVRVTFRGAARRTLVVPAAAVRRYGQVSSVYVVQGSVARLRLVQTGAAAADGVEVLAGVDAGEAVVTSPLDRVTDGAAVAITSQPGRTGGPS